MIWHKWHELFLFYVDRTIIPKRLWFEWRETTNCVSKTIQFWFVMVFNVFCNSMRVTINQMKTLKTQIHPRCVFVCIYHSQSFHSSMTETSWQSNWFNNWLSNRIQLKATRVDLWPTTVCYRKSLTLVHPSCMSLWPYMHSTTTDRLLTSLRPKRKMKITKCNWMAELSWFTNGLKRYLYSIICYSQRNIRILLAKIMAEILNTRVVKLARMNFRFNVMKTLPWKFLIYWRQKRMLMKISIHE